mmetsp:Transcript_374/g.512  ORF Transcript_374/g.512 Transcript_374/m.512 type:complete len:100 (-) Transcript_374:1036-1335(-)
MLVRLSKEEMHVLLLNLVLDSIKKVAIKSISETNHRIENSGDKMRHLMIVSAETRSNRTCEVGITFRYEVRMNMITSQTMRQHVRILTSHESQYLCRRC